MGTKYPSIAASGFNATPPPDDGSQSASNLISWSGIKTKLADPLHTEIDAINTALVAALNTSVRQITTADSTVAGDHWRTVEIAPTVSNTITVSLGDASTMTTTYLVAVRNSSTISQIISRVTGANTIDGVVANVTIPSKSTILFTTNSTPNGYLSLSKFGPSVDTDPIVVGSADGTKKVRLEVDGLTTGTTRVWTAADLDIALGKYPTRQVFTSGSGTYTTPSGCIYLKIRMWGGGGGGGGGGAAGSAGGSTTFSTLTASGGARNGGAAGTGTNGDVNLTGCVGGGSGGVNGHRGGQGGGAQMNGCSGGGGAESAGGGTSAPVNSGGGGGGGGGATGTGVAAAGGSGGGYVEKLITVPSATYSYAVGAKGTGDASSGTQGSGGDGGSGLIIVDEFYN